MTVRKETTIHIQLKRVKNIWWLGSLELSYLRPFCWWVTLVNSLYHCGPACRNLRLGNTAWNPGLRNSLLTCFNVDGHVSIYVYFRVDCGWKRATSCCYGVVCCLSLLNQWHCSCWGDWLHSSSRFFLLLCMSFIFVIFRLDTSVEHGWLRIHLCWHFGILWKE